MEKNRYLEFIRNHLTRRDLLEQLAEESAEVGKAALKIIRAEKMSNNATPVTQEQAAADLEEELMDLIACCEALGIQPKSPDMGWTKWKRWCSRVAEAAGVAFEQSDTDGR